MSIETHLNIRSYIGNMQSHEHNYHQLVLPLEGLLHMEIGHQSGVVDANTLAIIPAGMAHSFEGSFQNQFVVADLPESSARELSSIGPFLNMDQGLSRYVSFLHHELSQAEKTGDGQCYLPMFGLLIELLSQRYAQKPLIDRRISRVRSYLEDHFSKPLTLAELAIQAHLSPRQLSELFRAAYGVAPLQYQRLLRMEKAKKLLECSRLSVQQIAEQVGYTHLSSFSKRFQSYHGDSPLKLRQNDKKLS